MNWRPTLGARPDDQGTQFSIWAPVASSVEVVLEGDAAQRTSHALQRSANGLFTGSIAGTASGSRYRYLVDGQGPFPDPTSRFQPEGVHGPSEVIDPRSFPWEDAAWKAPPLEDLVIYELHVGTFSSAGTFAGVAQRLTELVELGITAIEIMPVADFPGGQNWGYDGVSLFAPARCYGRPDDLRRLVNEAHRLGLAVILDVVYNHLGPDGNYLGVYSPYYFSKRHHTPWGAALNFDGEHCEMVRGFFIENALHWIHEYHVDGLRLDATHGIIDDSGRHFLADLVTAVQKSASQQPALLIAEDNRNLSYMIKPEAEGGWGLDAVWADGFHHQMRRLLAGDHEGYYIDYTGTTEDLATTIRLGWFYTGQFSAFLGEPRGTDPAGIPPRRFVICLQNHDQIGNRALGERIHHQIDLAAYRAATALLLTAPQTPLIFMGQEWAASTPFLYFTDHNQELGKLVTEGRRKEFCQFAAFADPAAVQRIPDPQALSTFMRCKLVWEESQLEPHSSIRRLYQELLRLRRTEPALRGATREGFTAEAVDVGTVALLRTAEGQPSLTGIFRLAGSGTVDVGGCSIFELPSGKTWEVVMTTEDAAYCSDPSPPRVERGGSGPVVHFTRPSAVLLRDSP